MGSKSGVTTTTNPLNFITFGRSKNTNSVSDRYHQPSLNAVMDNDLQTDIRMSNNSQLQMAIADFWHYENITDRVVDSHRFKILITKARFVGIDFRIPN